MSTREALVTLQIVANRHTSMKEAILPELGCGSSCSHMAQNACQGLTYLTMQVHYLNPMGHGLKAVSMYLAYISAFFLPLCTPGLDIGAWVFRWWSSSQYEAHILGLQFLDMC